MPIPLCLQVGSAMACTVEQARAAAAEADRAAQMARVFEVCMLLRVDLLLGWGSAEHAALCSVQLAQALPCQRCCG